MPDFHVVVIGAGNGGLTSALTLARNGLKVLLLEKHNIPGGCATSFIRGRFEFEVSLHQLSGIGSEQKPGPLRMLLTSLGVIDDHSPATPRGKFQQEAIQEAGRSQTKRDGE